MDVYNIKPVVFDPKYMIPNEIVDDVICRFLLNIPKEEKFEPIRVCFQVELAHWYFLDYYCGEGCSLRLAQLRNMPYNQFAYIMFQKTPHLKSQLSGIDMHLAAFREYKMRVPTYGAILMNQSLTKVVLVQGFRNHWGFPKGKVNEVEMPVSCAIREVFEETGYDISPLVNEHHYIESKILERNDRLYLVRGVDPNFAFQPQTQFEIKNIKWFNINELPEHKKDTNPGVLKSGVPISNFYSVYPYVKRLKMWVADKLEGRNKLQNFKVRPEPGEAQLNSSNQRNSNRGALPASLGVALDPFDFQQHFKNYSQHFLQGGAAGVPNSGGWQLFPTAQAEQQKPFVMNSNALEELLFSQQNLSQVVLPNQNQNRQGLGSASTNPNPASENESSSNKGNKNPRRRLFSEEQGVMNAGIIGKPSLSRQNILESTGSYEQNNVKNSRSLIRNQLLSAPAWANFAFDRERLYKAFFTPPPSVSM